MTPRLISISWVRNEADILESFVRHALTHVDEMVIVNNASTDDTDRILEDLRAEGLPIRVLLDDSVRHRQGQALTDVMHELSRTEQAWLLPLDADEFVVAEAPLRTLVALLPTDRVTLLPWRTYVPTPEDDASEPSVLRRIRHRKETEEADYVKILIPPALQTKEYSIPLGSHALVHSSGTFAPSERSKKIALAHFPVRSARQIHAKVHEGWARLNANPDKKPGECFHWERFVAAYPDVSRISPQDLRSIASSYALEPGQMSSSALVPDPLPCAFELKYTASPETPGTKRSTM